MFSRCSQDRCGPWSLLLLAASMTVACTDVPAPAAPVARTRPALQAGAAGPEAHTTMVAFGRAQSDAAVRALLSRHGVRPVAIYMTVLGVTAIGRSPAATASAELIASTRQRLTLSLQRQVEIGPARARRFLAHTAVPLEQATPAVREQFARGLLFVAARNEEALRHVHEAAPLIYGLEIVGPESSVRAFQADVALSKSAAGVERLRGASRPRPDLPEGVGSTLPKSADPAALSSSDVHERLRALAAKATPRER